MGSDDDLEKLIARMRQSNKEDFDTNENDIDNYVKDPNHPPFRLKFILERLSWEIYRVQERTLDYSEYFRLVTKKVSYLEDRINQNQRYILDLSKHVKETESLQDELQHGLKKAQKDAEEFKEVAEGIKSIIQTRSEDLEKNNKDVEGNKEEKKDENI
jgi:chromosome segregation ATPase